MTNVTLIRGEQEFQSLPHNLEAEQALLGAILINNQAIEKTDYLKPEHFFEPVHGRLFEAIKKITDKGQIADPIKLRPYFENDEALEDVGGASYIVRLASSAPTVFNPEDYARTIYDLALRRDLIEIAENLLEASYDAPIDAEAKDLIESAEHELFTLTDKTPRSGAVRLTSALDETLRGIESARRVGISGVSTGLGSLDRLLGGLHRTDLIILAGRPGMGKSALALNIAQAVASENPVLFFSLEMSKDQLGGRLLAEATQISSEKLRRGELNDTQFREVVRAKDNLDLPLFIDDTPGLSMAAVRTRARRLKRLENIELVVIDYLQLMTARGENRVQEVSEISRGLKGLAKELKVPVLALSQLSRQVESRNNKRPLLSDLRESGTIEQDADVVMFAYRGEYYAEKEEPADKTSDAYAKWEKAMERLRGKAEVIIGKQRHGPTGTVHLDFIKHLTKFRDAE